MRKLAILAPLAALLLAFGAFAASGGDSDGDGIPDAQDTCPLAYDSFALMRDSTGPNGELIRSGDYDHDGIGNACDPTPGVPADHADSGIFLRASDGSRIRNCADAQITYHYSDGRAPLTTSANCTTYSGWAEIRKSGLAFVSSVEYTITRLPDGCTSASPMTLNFDTSPTGVWNRASIFFSGPSCGIGITKPETTTATTATTTTTATPAPAAAPPIALHDTLSHAGATATHTVSVPTGVSTVTITLRWNTPATVALTRVSQPGSTLSVTKHATKTSLAITVSGVEPGRLAYTVAARKVSGPTAVTTRITRR